MKNLSLFICLCFFAGKIYTQTNALDFTIQLSADCSVSNQITLNWKDNQANGSTYLIWRKTKGTSGWGSSIASINASSINYTDNTTTDGDSYEYQIQKRNGNSITAWSYINAGKEVEVDINRGNMLLLIDSTFINSLSSEISTLQEDLLNDGYNVFTQYVDRNDSVVLVKSKVLDHYNTNNISSVYLLGHVPVPYSGNLYPDGHTNHEGAWPADVFYAELDGNWTDNSVNNTVASDSRNHNVPGDGKYDNSKLPNKMELEIARVDFANLPAFNDTEEDLLRNYLNKAHDFKIAGYVPSERGLIDQGNFTSFGEGFAQNGYRPFTAFFDTNGVDELDYLSTLSSNDYLWSYGCGAGSHTSCNGLNNGSNLTTSNLASNDIQTTFTMLFGSYFGDWDKSNNLMRAALASGKTLSIAWSGRPNWHFHNMALGSVIGECALQSQDLSTDYLSLTLPVVTQEGVYVALLADPSLRMYYLQPASNLTLINNNNNAELSWSASLDNTIDGYNIYRKLPGGLWIKTNTSVVVGLSYIDNSIPNGGSIDYMVRAVKFKSNASGSFYNESLGSIATENFSVESTNLASSNIMVYPNPTSDIITLKGINSLTEVSHIHLLDNKGSLIKKINVNETQVDLSSFSTGIYFIEIKHQLGSGRVKVIKQ